MVLHEQKWGGGKWFDLKAPLKYPHQSGNVRLFEVTKNHEATY